MRSVCTKFLQFVIERIIAFQSIAKRSEPEIALLIVTYVEYALRIAITERGTMILSRHCIQPSEAFSVRTYPQTAINIFLDIHDSRRHSAPFAGREEMSFTLIVGIQSIDTILIGSHPQCAVCLTMDSEDTGFTDGIAVSLLFSEAIEGV